MFIWNPWKEIKRQNEEIAMLHSRNFNLGCDVTRLKNERRQSDEKSEYTIRILQNELESTKDSYESESRLVDDLENTIDDLRYDIKCLEIVISDLETEIDSCSEDY